MKKRIALLILAIVCLFGVCIVTASADSEPTTSIPGHNLALEDCVNIIYYASFENVPVGAEKGVLVWTSAQDSYTYGSEEAKLVANGKYNQYDKFFYGVPAKMMSQDIYAVSYIKDGAEITYSKLDKYSVLQYAYNKKGSTTTFSGGTITLGEFLVDMLKYGASAQKLYGYNLDRLANATYYQITVEGGTLPDGTTKGLYQAGASATLSSNFVDFDHWENGSEDAVGATNSINITVSQAETYTAVLSSGTVDPGADPGFVLEPIAYSEGLEFATNNDGTCYVEGIGTCTDTDIVIPPSSPAGDSVTSIGNQAFCNCTSLTSIEIPSSVTSIGVSAFYDCTALQYNIYNNAKYLGNASNPYHALMEATSQTISSCTIHPNTKMISSPAFYACASLTSITIPNSVTSIGKEAFTGCTGLMSITIPNSVTSIGERAFAFCSALTSIEIPSSVTSIGDSAFVKCTSLTSITIPSNVTSIGDGAFSGCTSLTSIEIPDSVTSIGSKAFGDCYALESMTVAEGNTVYHSAGNCIIETASKTLIAGCKNSVVPTDGSVTSIGEGAFAYCLYLTSIEIPNSVTSIGSDAFSQCTSLTSISIPEGVTNIGNYAFSQCISLTSITISSSVTSIGNAAFRGCTSLTSITIPNSVTSIGNYAFSGCTALQYNIYNNAKYLGNANNPYHVLMEATFKTISSCTIHPNTKMICSPAFYACASLTSITIPNSVTSIGSEAFGYCNSLTSITIPSNVTSIGSFAFYYCTSLASITYTGSEAEWGAISKGKYWNSNTGSYTIHCTDGDIVKE